MAYMVINLIGNLLKFIQMMHLEDGTDDGSFLTKKQMKLLIKVLISLMGYFGLYYLSGQLDLHLKTSDEFFKIQLLPACIGIEVAFVL